jgi:hypothetical protein
MASDFLKDFVACAGLALEMDDRAIVESGRPRGESGGLLRSQQEKFYQFIVWKAAYAKWPTEVEKNFHDLVIVDPTRHNAYACVFEMKNWLSSAGLRELPWILADIDGKLKNCNSDDSVFVLFSANDRNCMADQIKILEAKAFTSAPPPRRETYCFPTWNPDGTEVEFWMAAWPIKIGPLLGPL